MFTARDVGRSEPWSTDFDLYRIGDSDELDFIGIDELLDADALKLIEWAERGALPPPDVEIRLARSKGGRELTLEPISWDTPAEFIDGDDDPLSDHLPVEMQITLPDSVHLGN